jgi:hypothetical protein
MIIPKPPFEKRRPAFAPILAGLSGKREDRQLDHGAIAIAKEDMKRMKSVLAGKIAYYVVQSEPDEYGWADLVRCG